MTFSRSKSLLITLALIALILMAVLVLSAYNIRLTNNKTSELLNVVDQTANKEVLAQYVKSLQKDVAQDLKAFDQITLSSDKLVPLIESIESSGRSMGLDLEIVSVEDAVDERNLGTHKIRILMESRGAWAPTMSFLHAVESLPHRVMIEETSVVKEAEIWRLRTTLSLYSSE